MDQIRFHPEADPASHESIAGLINHSPLAIAVTVGSEHRYIFASQLYRLTFVGHDDSLLDRTAAQVIALPERQDIIDHLHRAFETGESQELTSLPENREAGRQFWDVKFLPIRDPGGVKGVLTLATDVTERIHERLESKRQAWTAMMESERFKLAVEATDLGFWDWNARTREVYWSARQRDIFGIPRNQPLTEEVWRSAIHPEDRAWVLEKVEALDDPHSKGQFHIEYRIVRPDGGIRCISSVGRMLYETVDGASRPVRLLGTILDITEQYKSEEVRQLLVQELDHRVKNLFAMASGIVNLTARTAESPEAMAAAICGRLDALARAHDLIRPAITGDLPQEAETSIDTIVRTIVAPHCDRHPSSRTFIEGPSIPIDAKAATSLTLVLHELATNASKYGALSWMEGQLRCVWRLAGRDLLLLWQESNGPAIPHPPTSRGFGSRLVLKTVTGQLGGEILYDWREEGLSVHMTLPLDHLSQETGLR